jgi:hypothetical protein
MSTLLYLASGEYRPIYEDLPFDHVILVDRKFNINRIINRPPNSKVELIEADALQAIKILKRRQGIKIDCLVSVNEGLFGGGGDYPIFSDFLLGYISPILADNLKVVTDIQYYGAAQIGKKVAKMDWGFSSQRVDSDNPLFIDPRQFTVYGNQTGADYGDVFILNRERERKLLPLNDTIETAIVHGSIWEDEQELDMMGINLRERDYPRGRYSINTFFERIPMVYNIHNRSIEEILAYAEENKVQHLGLTPWMNNDYQQVMDVLRTYAPNHLKKLTFYHLRRNDFNMFYRLV